LNVLRNASRSSWGRALRSIDGPDEVHLRSIAREELKKAKRNRRTMTDYLVPPLMHFRDLTPARVADLFSLCWQITHPAT
jgi:hypothetical protein